MQATVLFNPTTNGGRGETRAMRTKEDAHDYRYFPDPDLPPLVIAPEWVEQPCAAEMPELPRPDGRALSKGATACPRTTRAMVTQNKALRVRYFEEGRQGLWGSRSWWPTGSWAEISRRG